VEVHLETKHGLSQLLAASVSNRPYDHADVLEYATYQTKTPDTFVCSLTPLFALAREVALSDEYAEVRRKHPAIERKLNEFVRHHGTRRARFRGRLKVKIQQLLTATAINMKRMIRLLGEQRVPTGTLAAC
jgi:hypothetical protein